MVFEITAQPDQKTAEQLTKPVLAHAFEIVDEDSFIASWPIIQRHDEVIKKLTEGDGEKFVGFDGFVNGLHKMHVLAVQLRRQFVQPVIDSKERWLKKREAYRLAQERKLNEQRARDAEILRKEQAKTFEKDAKKLERQGDSEAATVLRQQAATLPTPTLPLGPVVPKQAGSVTTPKWEFEVENYDQVPEAYKLLDHTKKGERDLIDSKIRAIVSKLGAAMPIPGVRVWNVNKETSRAVR